MFSRRFVVLSMILSSAVLTVNAIRCYECNSADDPECYDPSAYRPDLRSTIVKECKIFEKYGNYTPFCRKTVFEISKPQSQKRVYRTCGWIPSQLPCYIANNDGHLETSCQCFVDGCNGSSHVYALSAVSLIVLSFIGLKL